MPKIVAATASHRLLSTPTVRLSRSEEVKQGYVYYVRVPAEIGLLIVVRDFCKTLVAFQQIFSIDSKYH
jgi:hypothetical protein